MEAARRKHGLPTLPGPVFVNLNNLYKLTPQLFASWLSILAASPTNATLSMLSLPSEAAHHLIARAPPPPSPPFGFVDYLPKRDHMSRAAAATVFLDTHLVNAHTTAMDVGWSCLPAVTLPHERFSARVGASILAALGCPDTLARTHDDYEQIAVRLGSSEAASDQVRRCLETAKRPPVARIWDTARWVREWERGLKLMADLMTLGEGGSKGTRGHHTLPAPLAAA